ncbi:radical SAM protein [Anaerosporomusa subterranea]|uniref:Radical SAM protein n=1 Tax=Anaerosporomusa subterranea TaxID=1794912 RepID=A0A154BUY9_ANASB|nr:AmmeMemoRadiSam system radical SAM enzyme [Anaerosporomusa subterranea]KYZ77742.1 radical SAM protein [Anaerosporomusa subterranea]
MKAAEYFSIEGDGVRCCLCPHNCLIRSDKTGFCRTRVNRNGSLYITNYGACTASAIDPIEKKPLYHFYPGADILSLGSWGCNFNCRFCQNWHLTQTNVEPTDLSPQESVNLAISAGKTNIGIAYTYSEPGVWFEYVRDAAIVARSAGLANVVVTNGYINPKPLAELLTCTDAMNIDVKAFTEDFYKTVCSGELHQVMSTVESAVQACHVEVTTLVIPGMNDSMNEISALAKWLATLSPDIPLHLSRYFPNYQMNLPATPLTTLQQAWQTAREYLHYVYIGNIGPTGTNTDCPGCGALLIERCQRKSWLTKDKLCPECGQRIPIIGQIMY